MPGTHGLAVLVGHDSGNLIQVRQVVHGPSREELVKRDFSEGGVPTAEFELSGREVQRAEFSQVL